MSASSQDLLSPQQLAEVAGDHLARPEDWISRVRLTVERRWYERIHLADSHDVWLISWPPGQATGFHDHGPSAGAFAVAWGFLEELFDGAASIVGAGAARSFGPRFVHNVRNVCEVPVVSVHAYSPQLTEMTRYDVTAEGFVARRTESLREW